MKKQIKFLAIILMAGFISLLTAFSAKAEDIKISKYTVNSQILTDGSLELIEDLTFDFNDKFNGVYKDIAINGTDGIYGLQVSKLDGNTEIPFTKVTSAKNGDEGVYKLLKEKSDLYRVQIYSPSRKESKTFRIKYKLLNVAVKHADTAELYYKFWGKDSEIQIDNFRINVALPSRADFDELKAFAHGPLDGSFRISDNQNVEFYVPHVPSNTFVEARILFPNSIISQSANIDTTKDLTSILREEESFKKAQAAKIKRNQQLQSIFNIICASVSVISIFIIIAASMRFRRKELNDVSASIFPEDCTPAVTGYLYNHMLAGKDIFATLLDLWRKGYVTFEEVERNPEYKMPFGKDKHKEYKITKTKEPDSFLLKHEKYFMDWIISKIGNGSFVYTYEIEKFTSKSTWTTCFNEWNGYVKEEAKKRNYFDSASTSAGIQMILFFVIEAVLSIIGIVFKSYLGIASFIMAIIILIYGIVLITRRSDYGEEQFLKWKRFKKYIENFKPDYAYNDNMVSVDMYLPYSIVLGVTDKALKSYRNYLSTAYPDSDNWIYLYLLFDGTDGKHPFSSSFYSSFNCSSSGSFSSGGGGGAGGGGAGGF